MNRRQLTVFITLLLVDAFCAFATYAFFTEELTATMGVPMPDLGVSNAVVGLANAGIVIVLYGAVGLLGYWFARKLDLPGIFSQEGNGRRWFLIPGLLGLACGLLLVIGDILFAPINGFGRFVHPEFPISILASLSAGIGEEILFRGFVFGIWGLLLTWLLKRFTGRSAALWIANVIAALAFGAGHLGTLLLLTGASSIAELNPVLLLEVFLLNGIVGLVAGERYMKDGLLAAAGVHFWADVVFHVLWGLF
ncbi:MAG TPA: CPBP family glutamic-type intramembrane protease [Anaerolineales bacterium]|nr:CPBP family glutamic-type intramembrane protease [Anaerolineales bacterium]